ncbi:peptide-methionine (R)-S-oxide reductase MsrB [Maricaulis parjimensis]|uniref:peptide-methionine (R)-S-oxide reductase MsrB n=1 Tax=Maricaulis parjimensis TaxID=144023 RepID=UPI001939C2B9|nr:peptide-methionine (R)-S-oxide reductase MsrB [Maricaulis parjimensis]
MPKLTDSEIETLKAQLDPLTYAIAFEEGTEHAFTHPLNLEKRSGQYHCKVCGEHLFEADHKYESGSGWPSFFDAADKQAVDTKTDYKLIAPRTEIHCANCGAHLGHVFPDGPEPTGLRYCTNGTVLDFRPAEDES